MFFFQVEKKKLASSLWQMRRVPVRSWSDFAVLRWNLILQAEDAIESMLGILTVKSDGTDDVDVGSKSMLQALIADFQ